MSYIEAADVTDVVISRFTLTGYIAESDGEMADIAERQGVATAQIKSDPLHYKVKRCLVVFVCMRVAQDNMGVNNVDVPELEKYVIKYNVYRREYEKLKTEISPSMITGNVDEARDRANLKTGVLYRAS